MWWAIVVEGKEVKGRRFNASLSVLSEGLSFINIGFWTLLSSSVGLFHNMGSRNASPKLFICILLHNILLGRVFIIFQIGLIHEFCVFDDREMNHCSILLFKRRFVSQYEFKKCFPKVVCLAFYSTTFSLEGFSSSFRLDWSINFVYSMIERDELLLHSSLLRTLYLVEF